ncbi:Hypothetical protein PHPALM_16621 [Phytophthora palmivora]|uniref:Uncharacterized protein n=1 Tax=Phytophthora palmivora TaxID=4796 RepID=A0A2P4XPB6_9STRA|nr:Hypothetical protein PHPALM_16621 [Phytophthora palmivora]
MVLAVENYTMLNAVGEEGSELDGQVEGVSEGGEEPGDHIFEGSGMAGHGRGQCGVACGERDDIVAPEAEQNIGDNEHSDQGEVTSELYVDSLVAFTPTKERWMVTKILKPVLGQVGNSYIVGRVCKRTAKKKTVLYEIRWLDSLFQNQVHLVEIGVVQRGIENYWLLTRTTSTAKPTWNALITVPENESLPSDATIEDLVEMENLDEFDLDRPIPTSLREVEDVKSMKFDPRLELEAPTDLYSHSDGSTKTRVRPDSIRLFTHSASSSFLAYIPLYFWRQLVNETNAYGVVKACRNIDRATKVCWDSFLHEHQ